MNILLVGHDYYLQNYCKYISTLNYDINVYVLSTANKPQNILGVLNIKDEADIMALINTIDRVYFFDDGTIPAKVKVIIEKNANDTMLIYTVPLFKLDTTEQLRRYDSGKPSVLIIYDGNYHSCADLELQLVKCFFEQNVQVSYSFSAETTAVIKTFEDIIQLGYLQYLYSEDPELIISSIDSRSLMCENNTDVVEYISAYSPDFVIFCQEKINRSQLAQINVLQYKYGLPVDVVVSSEYLTYDNEFGHRLHCKNKIIEDLTLDSIAIDSHVGEIIATKIFNKLYMPQEINRLPL